jgi:hypothetical protein
MNLGEQAYSELYGSEPRHEILVRYHGRLQEYNATIRKTPRTLTFMLSRKLEQCEPEIQMGVMQFLLNKLNKTKIKSEHIEMYHSFLKKMSDIAPVTKSDPILEASFKRVNEKYFNGMLAQPNLVWGRFSTSLLGTYTYGTDTIMVSSVMENDDNLLDYIMHHEMLHKKHKFNHSSSRTHSHTKAFRLDEGKFEDKSAEQKLRVFLSMRRPQLEVRKLRPQLEKPSFVQKVMGWI